MTATLDMKHIARCMMYEALADALEAARNAALTIAKTPAEAIDVRETFKVERARLTQMWIAASGMKVEPIPASIDA